MKKRNKKGRKKIDLHIRKELAEIILGILSFSAPLKVPPSK